jgi:hypothetical protein
MLHDVGMHVSYPLNEFENMANKVETKRYYLPIKELALATTTYYASSKRRNFTSSKATAALNSRDAQAGIGLTAALCVFV